MKVYSIGRDLGCDIIINDNTDVISRRHATLNVESSGKMTIVDLSHNGTYVNGIRINQNVPVPVTRKDTVSFAHVAQLDWNQIPNTQGMILRYVLLGLLGLLLIGAAVWGFTSFMGTSEPKPAEQPAPVVVDSAALKQKEKKMKEDEQARMDSIKKHVQDSLNKARAAKAGKVKAKTNAKKADAKTKEAPKKEEPKQKRFH